MELQIRYCTTPDDRPHAVPAFNPPPSTLTTMHVRPLTESDIDPAARILADAHLGSPVWRWVVPYLRPSAASTDGA